MAALATALEARGRESGLAALGFTSADPFVSTRDDLQQRKADGLHGGMQFTYRNPARSTEPGRILTDARSLVVGARSYRTAEETPVSVGSARVARYARSDHYGDLAASLESLAELLRGEGWSARVVADDNALVDRAAAYRAGIGWFGKNTNLLLPGSGSWFVLGAVVTDALLPESSPVEDGCGRCTACLSGCPTDAIIAPGVLDARRCLAWLVQAPGEIPEPYRVAMGDRVYGCDDCQEVCPPNRVPRHAPGARHLSGPVGGGVDAPSARVDGGQWVELAVLLTAPSDELLARFGRWYIPRRDPRYLRRNALVVVGNTPDLAPDEVFTLLWPYLVGPDPLLRAHAVWAARRHRRQDVLRWLPAEVDMAVVEELNRPVEPLV